MSEHTPTPWVYRQSKFDDWGWIRGPAADGERHGDLAAVAKGGDDTPFDEHRRNGTDPYAANAAFIVKAVNCHEALVKALKVLLKEAVGFSVSGVYFDEECMGHKGPDLAREALALVGTPRTPNE